MNAPGFIGTQIGQYDECTDMLKYNSDTLVSATGKQIARLYPLPDEIDSAEQKIRELPNDIRQMLPEQIGVYFVFATS